SRPDKGRKIVELLCNDLETEKNLRVVARVTKALSGITKAEFKPLDREAVTAWWTLHKGDSEFVAPYSGVASAVSVLEQRKVGTSNVLKDLDLTIAGDSDALYARCLKGFVLT